MKYWKNAALIIVAICGIVVVLIALSFQATQQRWEQDRARIYTIARQYDYTEDALLAEYYYCQDLNTRCNLAIAFTSDHSREVIEQKIALLSNQDSFSNLGFGITLFNELNGLAKLQFAVDGYLNPPLELTPPATRWTFPQENGKFVTLALYELKETKRKYTNSGQVIRNNIIILIMQTYG